MKGVPFDPMGADDLAYLPEFSPGLNLTAPADPDADLEALIAGAGLAGAQHPDQYRKVSEGRPVEHVI